jgi:hypothetical protein
MTAFVYLQNWSTGEVVCREVDEFGDFEILPQLGLASDSLSYINRFWRILPEPAPVGSLPEEDRSEFLDFFIRFYRDRTIYHSAAELLAAVKKFQIHENFALN